MIQKMKQEDFNSVYELMEQSFPLDEYRTYEEQKALLEDSRYGIYLLPDTGKRNVKAFIALWTFDGFAFIEHFAVNPAYPE